VKGKSMLQKNVGTIDRALRVILGIALLVGFFLGLGGAYNWLFLIGVVPLATGLLSSCPGYTILGVSTCPADPK